MIGPWTEEVLWTLTKDDGRAEVICARQADAIEMQYVIDSHCYYTQRYGVVENERERALQDAQAMREDFEARGWIDNSPSPMPTANVGLEISIVNRATNDYRRTTND